MKAVIFHGVGDIRLEDVPEPAIEQPTDAIVRITATAICQADLHFVRGTFPGMKEGTILGHEAVGVIEQFGHEVRKVRNGSFDPTGLITRQEGLGSATDAYRAFDLRRPGWLKVELIPSAQHGAA